jgi:peptide subunit release factor RF-3
LVEQDANVDWLATEQKRGVKVASSRLIFGAEPLAKGLL